MLQDLFGRSFSYLRLSVTEECNFRCVYCLPQGYRRPAGREEPLSVSEIKHLVTAFAELGLSKIRLTGGEPTLRRDLVEIIRVVRETAGITQVALSTNGHRLSEQLPAFMDAGISAMNVSVDTLNPEKFREVTGSDRLPQILSGIDQAIAAGMPSVKINAVLLKSLSEDETEFQLFLDWIRNRPVAVRFIELMPTAVSADFFSKNHTRGEALREKLTSLGWRPRLRSATDGPADEYTHSDFRGRMGVITPYAKNFCGTCNRLRITSQGSLRLCLFAEGGHSLRPLLQHPDQKDELQVMISSLLQRKEVSHYLPTGLVGDNRTFSAMGG